ncbi:hypothetical protein ACFVZH_26100 [Streptomyces sp. NPDC059534]|uniref:hypothetical protein n=1 Tax=Streptomyces sp. NPDC059534 TaxID=3346859 RepID=UPI00367D5380
MLLGRNMITSEAKALCGSQVIEQGQTCVRGSGDSAVRFGADEAQNEQDTSKDIFGWIVVLVGGAVSLGGAGPSWPSPSSTARGPQRVHERHAAQGRP